MFVVAVHISVIWEVPRLTCVQVNDLYVLEVPVRKSETSKHLDSFLVSALLKVCYVSTLDSPVPSDTIVTFNIFLFQEHNYYSGIPKFCEILKALHGLTNRLTSFPR